MLYEVITHFLLLKIDDHHVELGLADRLLLERLDQTDPMGRVHNVVTNVELNSYNFV